MPKTSTELAVKGRELSIPKRPATEITAGFHESIRKQVATVGDEAAIKEALRRLDAWHAYVRNREQQNELNGAMRWCEIRLGELDQPAEWGGDRIKSPAGDLKSDTKQLRHKFRLLAEHKRLVAKLIRSGKVSRSAILAAIREETGASAKNGKPLAEHDSLAGALERLHQSITDIYGNWPESQRTALAMKLRAYADEIDSTGGLRM